MFNFIFGILIAAFLTYGLIKWVKYDLEKQSLEKTQSVYRIQFKKPSDKVDLTKSQAIRSHAVIATEYEDSYVVNSDINSEKLRKLIMEEFKLKPSQVVVTSTPFINPFL